MGERGAGRFAVHAWSAWAPGRETCAAWQAWAGAGADAGNESTPVSAIPMMLRRRATPLGQKILAGAFACGEALRNGRYILASRHGEFIRMQSILKSLDWGELPSPADFSMSVHHALAGLASISTGNMHGHTALAAGLDSFGFGLVEAAACLAERPEQPVLLLYGDEPLSGGWAVFGGDDLGLPLAIALALHAPQGEDDAIVFEAVPRMEPGAPKLCAAVVFMRFLLSAAPSAEAQGVRMDWRWRRAC